MNEDEISSRVFEDMLKLFECWDEDKIPKESYLDRCIYISLGEMINFTSSKKINLEVLDKFCEDMKDKFHKKELFLKMSSEKENR